MQTGLTKKKQVRRRKQVAIQAPRPDVSCSTASPTTVAPAGLVTAVKDKPSEENDPNWRTTELGAKARQTPPWLFAALVFGLPIAILVLLAFLI